MTRKCRLPSCRAPLPKLRECESPHQRAGYCGAECSYAYARKNAEKLREKARQEQQRQHKQQKRKHKQNDYAYQFKLTRKAAQLLANRLDWDRPCICCDRPRVGAQFCGGHFKTAGGHPELALDLRNIHGQHNQTCNLQKSGNIEGDKYSKGYRQGLVDRYGQELVDYLESYHPPKQYTCDELIALRKELNQEIRKLEKGERPSRDWRALPEEQRQPLTKAG